MKLEIIKLNKSFNGTKIIEDASFSFNEYRFYGICGESGCGKTTLLNILSLIEAPDTNSEIRYDGKNVLELNDEEKRDFRLRNIGYIFQSFNLFNDDTVFNNIALVIDSISNFSLAMRKRKIRETLKLVGLENLEKKYVRDLSGGEKQRVAIARALVNNPKIVFTDEPTGSLDEINSNIIFDILRKISSNCTVICVTHDKDLANRFCDSILYIKNKSFEEVETNNTEQKNRKNFLIIERKKKERGELSRSFIYRHFYNTIKVKKYRFIIASILLSISLFSIGLSTFLKEGISESLKSSFSSIINENTLVLKKKGNIKGIIDYVSSSLDEVNMIKSDYKSDIDYIGANYLVNFESFFKDQNNVYDISRPLSKRLDGFNARSFNEFKYLKSLEKIVDLYPNNIDRLMEDEVIISMNYAQMKSECEHLQIARSFDSLADFISSGKFIINLTVTNNDWKYNDNLSFRVKGVIASKDNNIYHTNNFFNETLFEKKMRLPSSLNIKKIEEYPWVMKKVYYLKTKDFQASFLNKISKDSKYKNYVFDNDNNDYSPRTCLFNELCYSNKLYLYTVLRDDIPLNLATTIQKYDENLKSYYFSTNSGYLNLGTQLFSGFARETYFSLDKTKLTNLVDAASRIQNSDLGKLKLENNILEGFFSKIDDSAVRFSSSFDNLLSGRKPNNCLELVISKKMDVSLGGNSLNKELFIATLNKKVEDEFSVKNYFKIVKVNVVGIVDSSKNTIYNAPDFSISLFRDLFQFSSFSLVTNSIVFEVNTKLSEEKINSLNKTLEFYEFTNPLNDFEKGINETLSYLEYILIALAIVTLISSISLIGIINYINIVESKRDYAILFVLGYSFKEILKMQFINSILPNFLSFCFGSVSIVLISKLLGVILSENLGISTMIYASYKPFLAMFFAIILISVVSVIISIGPIKKINIAKALH